MLHERAVDLEHVHGKAAQIAEGRVAGPKVVDRDPDAEAPECFQRTHHGRFILQKRTLCDLKLEPARIDPGLGERSAHALHESPATKLMDGKIDRHRKGGAPGIAPAGKLPACFQQHPVPERADQPGLLAQGNEDPRQDEALLGVAPAQEGLETGESTLGQRHLRLVVQLELTVLQAAPQLALEDEPLEGHRVHRLGVELVVVSAPILGVVHRCIGIAQQGLDVVPIERARRDADAPADHNLVPFQREGHREGVEDAPCDLREVLHFPQIGEQDGELIAPQTRYGVVRIHAARACDHIARPHSRNEPVRNSLEESISHGMTKGIVDALEVVEVEEQDAEHAIVSARLRERHAESLLEQETIAEARQTVVVGEIADLLLGLLALCHVLDRALEALGSPVFAEAERHLGVDNSLRAVWKNDAVINLRGAALAQASLRGGEKGWTVIGMDALHERFEP